MAERLRRSMVAVAAAVTVWDEERWHVIEARALQSCREAGLLTPLVIYVNSITIFTVWHGDFAEAASLEAEAESGTGPGRPCSGSGPGSRPPDGAGVVRSTPRYARPQTA